MPNNFAHYHQTVRYYIEVTVLGNSEKRVFKNCNYTWNNNNHLCIETCENTQVEFIGVFSASIISMENYQNARRPFGY